MEKKHTVVYFLTSAALIAFAVILFGIPSGNILTAYEDGTFNYSTLLKPLLAYGACILGFLGIITLLQEMIEASLWFSAGALLLIIGLVSYFLNMMALVGFLVSLVFGGWFLIAGIRSLISSWYDYEPWLNIAVTLCRVAAAAAILSYIFVWLTIPTTVSSSYDLLTFEQMMADPAVHSACTLSGILSIVAAIGVAIEGVLWLVTLED